MNQQESTILEKFWQDLRVVAENLRTLAVSQDFKEAVKDSCVDKVTSRFHEIDNKLNDIIIAVSSIKAKINGSASANTEHVWNHLAALTVKLDSLATLQECIETMSDTVSGVLADVRESNADALVDLNNILREMTGKHAAVVEIYTSVTGNLVLYNKISKELTEALKATLAKTDAEKKFWSIASAWLIKYGPVIGALASAVAAGLMAAFK